MKRTITVLVMIAFFAVAAMATAGTAAADKGGCPHGQVNTIIGTLGSDRLVGTKCADAIYGLRGRDVLIGRAGEDRLYGGRGRDRLGAVDGYADVVSGGRGFDRCRGDQLDSFRRCEVVRVFFVTPVHH